MNQRNHMKIGLGGGCHWCTEAVFMSLSGVRNVQQGWIASEGENYQWSEAVWLEFDPLVISLKDLIQVHLNTHASTSSHSMRQKYRSAVYYSNEAQKKEVVRALRELSESFDKPVITTALKFEKLKLNQENHLEYFKKNGRNQFCERYIHPKLEMLKLEFSNLVDSENLN